MCRNIFIIPFLFINIAIFAQSIPLIKSPNGEIILELHNDDELRYSINFFNQQIIAKSKLGFELNSPAVELRNFDLLSIDSLHIRESWNPPFGEKDIIANNYNEIKLALRTSNPPYIDIDVRFRIFDDGVGFRYEFPEQPEFKHFIVGKELTQFSLAKDYKAYWIPGDYETNEYLYSTTHLSEIDALEAVEKEKDIALKSPIGKNYVQTPLLMQNDKGPYILLHEAALVNYPVMQLQLDPDTFTFDTHLVPDCTGNKAYLETGFNTPWRTIIISQKAEGILASDLILNLNEPSILEDVSWIKPQKFIGVWWEMHVGKGTWQYEGDQHAANTENVMRYIDFASQYGIEGVLVEGWNEGWEDWFGNWKEEVFDFVTPYPDYDIKKLSEYAGSKNVQLIMHHETSGSVTNYERRMDEAFAFMKKHNIDMVKTGYVGRIIPRGEHHDSQWMNNHYVRVAKKAADHKIMVISHESSRPTGLHRTYPNWMASEAARGNEFNNAPTLGITPEHESILSFTRLKGGPMDYTPGFFHFELNQFDESRKTRVNTTIAKQVALFAVFYSPIHMLGDLPENLQKYPDLVKFIVDIPLDWKESIPLRASPGDYVVYARMAKDGTWYVAGITDEEEREIELDFSFLSDDKNYKANMVIDSTDASYDQNPTGHQFNTQQVNKDKNIKIKMARGGGFIMKIIEESS
ncbi:MAG TPA: glycoside hydrolase family 97 protein [Anditalea sp.]|nr:glycoside hydrolase family 97 protein [Anditalea sp.]